METDQKLKYSLSSGKNEDAVTLIETLIALNVLMGCVLFFSLALTQIQAVRTTLNDERQIEWHLFLNQLEYDLRDKGLVSHSSQSINVKQINEGVVQSDVISYSLSNTMIRRTVSSKGHQPMLTKVKSLNVGRKDDQLLLKVVFENNESYSARVKVAVLDE